MELGIDKTSNLVYEGSGGWGHAVWPTPIILPLAFTTTETTDITAEDGSLSPRSYIFREDAFDPVSRVRYGRLYQVPDSQQAQWHVGIHPARPDEERQASRGVLAKQLYTFHSARIDNALRILGDGQPLIVLGTQESYTLWTILSREKTVSGDELITLKSRQTFGALPDVNYAAVPTEGHEVLSGALKIFENDIHRAAPESVIDRAREAATVVLSVYTKDAAIAPAQQELGKLIQVLDTETPKRMNVINAARIVQIFHSRGKHAEKDRRAVRTIVEQDAELAVQCIGTMLCDLGWGSWK